MGNKNVSLKGNDVDYEDVDDEDCFQESIVHVDGDKRKPIIESVYNKEDIIKCIGQLETDYKYIERGYEQKGKTYGTATVFCTRKNTCFALSAAHNIKKIIKECEQCNNYMDNSQNIIKCIHCNHNKLQTKVISATSIEFRRREIKKHISIYDEEEKETIHYEFGDNRKGYVCDCEYLDSNYLIYPFTTAGYDYCILSFINDDNYNYKKYCKNIAIKNEMSAVKHQTIPPFNIYGYPMTTMETDKHYKMYGMESTKNNYSVEISKYSNQLYFKHCEIDT
eukprot:406567_1